MYIQKILGESYSSGQEQCHICIGHIIVIISFIDFSQFRVVTYDH